MLSEDCWNCGLVIVDVAGVPVTEAFPEVVMELVCPLASETSVMVTPAFGPHVEEPPSIEVLPLIWTLPATESAAGGLSRPKSDVPEPDTVTWTTRWAKRSAWGIGGAPGSAAPSRRIEPMATMFRSEALAPAVTAT